MRAIDSKKATLIAALTTPRPTAPSRSWRDWARSQRGEGRAMSTKASAAQQPRSQAVPAGPMSSNRRVEAAAPTCTESIEPMISPMAGAVL